MSRQRVLVTGGAGFIGSNFVRYLLSHDEQVEVVNFDALSYSGNLENLDDVAKDPRYRFVRGDICDTAEVESVMTEVDSAVHFAAESHVDRSILDSRPFVRTNVLGTQTLLDAAVRTKLKRFVHVSTDETYGSLPLDRPEQRFDEESPIRPNSPYAASKAASDMLVRAYCHTFGLAAIITRCSNNFGPYQFPEKVIPLFVTNLLEGRKVPLYGDGRNVRDWIHVEDHCEALAAVLQRGRPGEVYNIGGDNERSNLELTHTILEIMDMDEGRIEYVKDRPGGTRLAADSLPVARRPGRDGALVRGQPDVVAAGPQRRVSRVLPAPVRAARLLLTTSAAIALVRGRSGGCHGLRAEAVR